MECQLPTQTFKVDGHELVGWEIRLFKANLGIQRKELLVEEVYQCCAVIYRGVPGVGGPGGLNPAAAAAAMAAAYPPGKRNKIYWNDREGEATEMLNFLKVDQIVKAYDGLVLRNGAGSNNVNGRARVSGSSGGGGGGPANAVSPTAARRLGEQQTRRSSEDTARLHAQAGVMH